MLLQLRFSPFLPLQWKGKNSSQFTERCVLAYKWAFGLKQGSPRQTGYCCYTCIGTSHMCSVYCLANGLLALMWSQLRPNERARRWGKYLMRRKRQEGRGHEDWPHLSMWMDSQQAECHTREPWRRTECRAHVTRLMFEELVKYEPLKKWRRSSPTSPAA